MAVYGLTTFEDILNAILEEVKIPSTDTVEVNRIKRDINMTYVGRVAPAKRWQWLSGFVSREFKPFYSDGTVAVTPDSTTITFSIAPATSKTGYLFATDNYSEIYVIDAHTAGATTATLSTVYTGALATAATFKVWTDVVALPTDCRETVEVLHSFYTQPMKGIGLQEMRRIVSEAPKRMGRPAYYSTYDYFDPSSGDGETESDRYRLMRVYPSIYENSTTLRIDYVKEVTQLELDEDEPLMPIEDRNVLVYGALARAWKRLGDPQSAEQSERDFQEKLALMMGRVEDSVDTPQITPNSRYLSSKRGNGYRNKAAATSGSGTYNSPTYIKNATIEGGNVTANITVASGITIDGVDISALSTTVTDHIADTADAHDASAISFSPTGSIVATDVQAAIAEVSSDVTALGTLTDSHIYVGNASNQATDVAVSGDISISNTGATAIAAGVIVDADVNASAAIAQSKLALSITNSEVNASAAIAQSKLALSITNSEVNASAAIAVSKLAALTASKAVATDGSGFLTTVNASSSELNYLVNTEALQTLLLNDNQASAATIASWAHASYDSLIVFYSLKRGAGNKEAGTLMITTDGTDAAIAQSAANLGTLGVTFSVDVSGTDLRLRYTSTSTGAAPTVSWKVQKWLA